MDYNYLDTIAEEARHQDDRRVGVLSTGERIYVALASSRLDLIPDYTVAQAINRLGLHDTEMMVNRWRYR